MPGIRAPIMLGKKRALKAGIIIRRESSLYIMPGIRALILLVKKRALKAVIIIKREILSIYYMGLEFFY